MRSYAFTLSLLVWSIGFIDQSLATRPEEQDFVETINNSEVFQNEFMRGHRFYKRKKGHVFNKFEKEALRTADRYLGSYGPRVIRPIGDFTGDALVVGGERKGPQGNSTSSIAKIAGIDLLEKVKTIKFHPCTGKKIETEDDRAKLKSDLSNMFANDQSYAKYYVTNISDDVLADVIASAIDEKDMAVIPDHRFNTVYYERMDCPVFLHRETWEIMARITAIGGMIKVETGALACMRLIPTMVKGTRFEAQVNDQIARYHQDFADGKKPFSLTLTN